MKYNFDEIIDRTNTNSVMYDARKRFFGSDDVLPMWVADLGFKTPDFIVKAIRDRTEHEIFSYFVKPDSYDTSIISWLKRRHNWSIEKEWISFSPGVVSGITSSILAFSEPGDKIIVQPPVYFPFFESVRGTDRVCVENPLKLINNRYYFDFDQLISIIDKNTKILILCSPHNPGGMVWTEKELSELARICKENNILVISDEIHADLVFKPNIHIPFSKIAQQISTRNIVVMSASKTFNLAGLATSFLIIPDKEIKDHYEKLLQTMHLSMGNIFGTIALENAFINGDDWLDQMMDYLWCNFLYLEDFIKQKLPGIKIIKPESTYLVWLDFRDLGIDSQELSKILVEKARLGLFRGDMFGTGGEGFIRINIAVPMSILKEALNRLQTVIN